MRRHDWPEILARAVREARDKEFVWGEHDCCLWVSRTVDAMTGWSMADRADYDDQAGALKFLDRAGGLDKVAEALAAEHGCPEIPPKTAQRGDVVIADLDQGQTLGIVIGATAAFAAPRGLLDLPLRRCRRAWRIG